MDSLVRLVERELKVLLEGDVLPLAEIRRDHRRTHLSRVQPTDRLVRRQEGSRKNELKDYISKVHPVRVFRGKKLRVRRDSPKPLESTGHSRKDRVVLTGHANGRTMYSPLSSCVLPLIDGRTQVPILLYGCKRETEGTQRTHLTDDRWVLTNSSPTSPQGGPIGESTRDKSENGTRVEKVTTFHYPRRSRQHSHFPKDTGCGA